MKNKKPSAKKIRKRIIRKYYRKPVKLPLKLILLIILVGILYILIPNVLAQGEDNTFNRSPLPVSGDREMSDHEVMQDTANKIRAIARARNFKWEDYAVNIACCESWLGLAKENTKGNYPVDSVDRGTFAFNSYWKAYVNDDCAYNLACSTNTFMDMVEAGTQHHWVCDGKVKGNKNYSLEHCGVK